MIIAIFLTVVLTAVPTALLTYLWARRPKPDMPSKREFLFHETMAFVNALVHPVSPDNIDLVSQVNRDRAEELIGRYRRENT